MELWQWALLGVTGLLVGFVNVMAAGGSLLTLPTLILLGLDPVTANGTNRVGLLLQNGVASSEFRRRGFSDLRESAILAAMTLPGAITGAILAVHFDPDWFKRVLAIVMIGALVATLRPMPKPAQEAQDPQAVAAKPNPWLARLSMLGIGFYGGFIQAGVGFLIIASLSRLLRLDLIHVNMHKVFIIAAYNLPALIVFVVVGDVRWAMGLVLALGASLGARFAIKVQVQRGAGVVKVVFAIAIVAMAVKLLWTSL